MPSPPRGPSTRRPGRIPGARARDGGCGCPGALPPPRQTTTRYASVRCPRPPGTTARATNRVTTRRMRRDRGRSVCRRRGRGHADRPSTPAADPRREPRDADHHVEEGQRRQRGHSARRREIAAGCGESAQGGCGRLPRCQRTRPRQRGEGQGARAARDGAPARPADEAARRASSTTRQRKARSFRSSSTSTTSKDTVTIIRQVRQEPTVDDKQMRRLIARYRHSNNMRGPRSASGRRRSWQQQWASGLMPRCIVPRQGAPQSVAGLAQGIRNDRTCSGQELIGALFHPSARLDEIRTRSPPARGGRLGAARGCLISRRDRPNPGRHGE